MFRVNTQGGVEPQSHHPDVSQGNFEFAHALYQARQLDREAEHMIVAAAEATIQWRWSALPSASAFRCSAAQRQRRICCVLRRLTRERSGLLFSEMTYAIRKSLIERLERDE